jgi:hypothetical protein
VFAEPVVKRLYGVDPRIRHVRFHGRQESNAGSRRLVC